MDKKKQEFIQRTSEINGTVIAIRIRTNLRAGNWACRDCSGQALGNSLFKPNCGSCYQQ